MWKYDINIPCENIKNHIKVSIMGHNNQGIILSKSRCKNYRNFSMGCARHIQMNYRIDTASGKCTYYHAAYIREVECSRCIYCTDELLEIRKRYETNQ